MVVRVAQQAAKAAVDSVVVAVDDDRVADVVGVAGIAVQMTRADHISGSDRVMEVAELRGWSDDDVVINVQGDEPLVPPAVINQLSDGMREHADVPMATLSEALHSESEFLDPNVVKVVCNDQGLAMLFSRAPIPYPRDSQGQCLPESAARHVGIYAFRVKALRRFIALGASTLEQVEMLEQMRWLQAGYPLLVIQAMEKVPGGVDTPDDLARVQAHFSA
jgi:3-deoxy-manno-octulosonate cytidylyltransferase (CMP-KDO synthetase)